MNKAEYILELIRKDAYNIYFFNKPSSLIIKELVEVIKQLDRKLNQNEEDEQRDTT